jgi:hypothetical protein
MAFCRWDIIAEKFGFMLIFGDVVFIPFTFRIQASAYLNNIIAWRVFQLQQACRGEQGSELLVALVFVCLYVKHLHMSCVPFTPF